MYRKLKEIVFNANLLLPKYNLIKFTWGNVSQIDRVNKVVAIKPSGVEYEDMKVEDIVIVDLDGNVIEGNLKPSSDLLTHLELYKNFLDIGGVVHTHSKMATSFAQAGLDIKALGTTHADYFYGDIPCTRLLNDNELSNNYEEETGKVIVETFNIRKINPQSIPSVLVQSHGSFSWGKDAIEAVHNAVILEECANIAHNTILLDKDVLRMQQVLLDKHFNRKHGDSAYYGQD